MIPETTATEEGPDETPVDVPDRATCAISVFWIRSCAAARSRRPASAAASAASRCRRHQAVLGKYCVTCHNERLKSGGLALDALDLAPVGETSSLGEGHPQAGHGRHAARRTAAAGQGDRRQPCAWLETELDRAALAHPNPGRPRLQRLNRAEYKNAIRDLLALDIDAASMLPADNAATGSTTTPTR